MAQVVLGGLLFSAVITLRLIPSSIFGSIRGQGSSQAWKVWTDRSNSSTFREKRLQRWAGTPKMSD